MCYVTNLDHKTCACKLTRSKTCRNTTFTWLEHARPSTKSRHIIGAQHRGSYSYAYNVTVNRYNGHITGTNHIVRHIMSLTCTLRRMRANQRALKHAKTQPLHYSNTRTRAPNLMHAVIVIGYHSGASYSTHVTVYRYNVYALEVQILSCDMSCH